LAIGFFLFITAAYCNSVQAQAYSTPFTTSIAYQNIGTGPCVHSIDFYPDPSTTTPINIPRPDLAPNAGTSVSVGSLSNITQGFRGSAVLSATEPLAATLVQVPQSTTVKNRPLSIGFTGGAQTALIATVLKNQFGFNTIFTVQNAGGAATNVTIKFNNTSAQTVHTIGPQPIQAGAAFFVDSGTVTQLGASFNGSVVAEADPGGLIVASALELSIAGTGASAFEGLPSGDQTVFMPSAICQAFGANTSYAVQNTSLTTNTTVTANYSNGASQTLDIGPGSKQSFVACNATGMTAGFSGSATITSTGTPIVAIGKVYGGGFSSAFLGQGTGSAKLAAPYVRWSQTLYDTGQRQRAFIAIQNVGADLPAGQVTVKYLDKNGNIIVTDSNPLPLPNGSKFSTNPYITQNPAAAEFGAYPDGTFGGSAIIEGPAGSQLVAVTRIQSKVGTLPVSEDYNGINAN
jgi:hypothetical protein